VKAEKLKREHDFKQSNDYPQMNPIKFE